MALVDEQLSPQVAALLRQAGFDVEAVADRPDLAGHSDRLIVEVACGGERAVATNTIKDFRPLAAQRLARGCVHAALILLPSSRTRTRAAIATLADRVASVPRDNPGGLASSERWIGAPPRA
jgi:hypothetical protein